MKKLQIFTSDGRLNTKFQRHRDCKKSLSDFAPEIYKSNSTKEELCLEYINSFYDQFFELHPKRKLPFMIAENEFGIKKFVCTTIKPSQVPIPELYDLYECASFFAGYILYEPLDPINEYPRFIFSPSQTLHSHSGDCFDMSNLLVSFLIGAGYDAYIVSGYAPKFITLKDQSMTKCPMINQTVEISSAPDSSAHDTNNISEATSPTNYVPPDNSVKKSQYLLDLEEKKHKEGLDKFKLWLPDTDLDELEFMEREKSKDVEKNILRVHSWVLVKSGKRDVKENIFVEPSTGRIYQIHSSPYIGIESIWNNTNYWTNIQNATKVSEVKFYLFC